MEIRRFIKYWGQNGEEDTIFVKDGEEKLELYFEQEDMFQKGTVKKNGFTVAKTWRETTKVYYRLGLENVHPERMCNVDNEDNEATFDAAVEAAREWLYA